MIVNNLLIKLKDNSMGKQEGAKNVLSGLKGNIPVLLDSCVEIDINAGKSPEDLKIHLDHPVHVKAAEYITPAIEKAALLWYELQ
jgi:hypothetical protein